ncbi:MAG: four-helix bundle copper-binding protein [Alphaproteobacteria bacterium]|nr:four-helix bundle copper-binding protein [Alphaproteobacteria bacterium]
MQHDQTKIQECIQLAWQCRAMCQDTLFNYCLEKGGRHVAKAHVKVMTDCIEICQTAADFMTRHSDMHLSTCAACADVCEACAQSCGAMNDEEMKKCADICRRCAESCREMSKSPHSKAA